MVRYLFIFLFSLANSYLIADTSKPNPVSPSSANAGETGVDYWFFMEIEQGISAGDYLIIVFPSQFSDIGMGTGQSCLINDVVHSCSESNNVIVTITLSSTISSVTRLRVKVPNITNPSSSMGTGYFTIYSQMHNGGQIIDSNDAFGVIGFAKSVTSMTGAVTSTTIALTKTSDYTFTFTLASSLSAGSTFTITIPSPFSITSTTSCIPVAYSTGVAVIPGTYTCTSSGNILTLSGLSQNLASGVQVGIKVTSIMNPYYSLSASAANFIVQTIMPNSEIIVDRASISSLAVPAGVISSISHDPYTSGSDFSSGNTLYTLLNFTTQTAVPVGGTITIDYKATLDSSSCYIVSGLPNKTDGSFYSCAVSGTVATISNFGAIDAGKTISVANLLTVGSSSITSATITTSVTINSSSMTIDTNSATWGFTLASSYSGSQPTSTSFTYQNNAGGTGYATIGLTRTYSGIESFTIYMPSDCSITAGDIITLTWLDSSNAALTTISSPTWSGQSIYFQTTYTGSSIASTIKIAPALGFNYPTLASSKSHPLEWVIKIGSQSLTTLQTTLNPKAFDTSAGKTGISYSKAVSIYYPYTFSIQVDQALTIVNNRKLFFSVDFPTSSAFPDKLGTGYAYSTATSIPCSPYTLKDLKTASVTCTLTTASGSSNVKITNFDSIAAGTLISFTLLIQNGASLATTSITIKSGYTDSNSVSQIVQQSSISVTFSSTASTWTTSTISRDNTIVGTVTPLNVTLQLPTADSQAYDLLLIVFPALWSINSKSFSMSIDSIPITKYSLFQNSYAPAVYMTIDDVISHSASSILNIVGMKNGPYEGSGSGNLQVTMITNSTLAVQASSSVSLTSATHNTLTLSVSPNSMHQTAGDVTFRFSIVNPTSIPAGGYIVITFPSGFDLVYSTCSYSYLLSSASTCTFSSQTIKITGFTTIAAGTSFSVKVLTVKNPSTATSGSFSVTTYYDSSATLTIDSATYTGFNMTSAAVSGSVYITALSFFPMSAGTKGQFLLDFSLDSSVPHGGSLTITVPSSFSLPSTMDTSNCIFNLQYSSCSKSGNVITIQPYKSFPAGIEMILIIPDITVPTNSTSPIQISSMWSSLTMSTNPSSPSSAFYLNTYTATTTAIQATVNFWPKNAAELATYNFSLTTASQLNTTFSIVIWFPKEYPAFMGELRCSSSAGILLTGALTCDSSSYMRGVVLSGFAQTAAGTAFNIIIENVPNPISSTTTSAFSIVSIDANNKVIDQLTSSLTVTISNLPALLTLNSISLDNYSIFATAAYTFTSTFSSIPSKFQIWYRFPMENFDRELPGLSDSYNCSTLAVSKATSTATSSWVSSVTCSNPYHNLLVMSGASGSIGSSYYLQTTFKDVKSSSSEGISKAFVMSVFNVDTMSIVDRSYGTASSGDVVSYIDEKQDIIISTADGVLEITPGTQITFYIHTSSTKMPVRSDLVFTYQLLGNGVQNLVTISPTSINLSKGSISSAFTVMCPTGSSTGNYTIKWTMTGDTYDLYNDPPISRLIISNENNYAVSFEGIPTLMTGSTSIPLYVYLETAPSSGLSVTFTPPSLITVSALSFAAGSTKGSFTITVGATITVGIYTIALQLAGTDAASFYLSSSSLHVTISNYDTTDPGIASFVINNPKQQHMVDISFQATEASIFYYTYGERGLALPSNTSLISYASNNTAGYYTGYIGASFIYEFTISGLTTEHDYILYGILIDLNQNVMESVFSVDFYTAEYYDSIMITLKFASAVNSTLLTTTVINVLAQQLAISSSLIAYITPTSRYLDDSSYTTASYYIYSDPTSSLPSPQDSVTYMAIPSELNKRLSAYGITLDLTYNIAQSITVLSNPRPTWIEAPSATTTTKTAVTITLKCATAGTLYMQIINDGDVIPSSRQVTLGVNAYGKPATMVYNQTVAVNTTVTITYSNLLPESSYVVVITSKNNNARLPRIMSDDVMSKLQIITQAGTISSDNNSTSAASPIVTFGALLLIYLHL